MPSLLLCIQQSTIICFLVIKPSTTRIFPKAAVQKGGKRLLSGVPWTIKWYSKRMLHFQAISKPHNKINHLQTTFSQLPIHYLLFSFLTVTEYSNSKRNSSIPISSALMKINIHPRSFLSYPNMKLLLLFQQLYIEMVRITPRGHTTQLTSITGTHALLYVNKNICSYRAH